MNRDILTVGERADLFNALLVQPPSAKKTGAAQRDAQLCAFPVTLVSKYGLRLTRNDVTNAESASSVLAKVVALEEQTINRILRQGQQPA